MYNENIVERLRTEYPSGTRIKLIRMVDDHPIPPDSLGTVNHVDDMGQIHVKWDNGRFLAVIPHVDTFEKV